MSQIYFIGVTLQVSNGLCVHHQQFNTVHTATDICQTDTAVRLLAGTRWKNRLKYLEILQNKFETLVHLVGFTIEIYYDAWPYECQIHG